MAKLVQLNLSPDPKTLRQFGYVALAAFSLFAFLAWKERAMFSFGLGAARQAVTTALVGVGVVSLIFSLVFPRGNLPLYVGLSVVSYPIGFVVSHVILVALFLAVIGPVALILKLAGRDAMQRSYDKGAATYWVERGGERAAARYFRQF